MVNGFYVGGASEFGKCAAKTTRNSKVFCEIKSG